MDIDEAFQSMGGTNLNAIGQHTQLPLIPGIIWTDRGVKSFI